MVVAATIVIVDVPAFTVADALQDQEVTDIALAQSVIVPPALIVNPPAPPELVIDLPFVSNVPLVIVIETFVAAPQSSCAVQTPPIPLKTTLPPIILPAHVIVLPDVVALKVNVPVYVLTNQLYKVILHEIVIGVDHAHVTFHEAGAANVKSRQSFVVASIVTV